MGRCVGRERFEFLSWVTSTYGIGSVRTERTSIGAFHSSVDAAPLGTSMLVEVSAAPLTLERSRRDISSAEHDMLTLGILVDGRSVQQQRDREAVLHPGDMVLIDSRAPFLIDYDRPFRQLMVSFPREKLLSRVPNADALTATRVDGRGGAAAVASAMIQSLYAQRTEVGDAGPSLVEHALDLVALALGGAPNASASEERRVRRIRAFIEDHLGDPALSPRSIADACGVSVRYLHRLFERAEQTVDAYVWRRRLDRARSAIGDPRRRALSLTEIAFEVGFSDASHFSKAYRRAFGESPSEARRRSTSASLEAPTKADTPRGAAGRGAMPEQET